MKGRDFFDFDSGSYVGALLTKQLHAPTLTAHGEIQFLRIGMQRIPGIAEVHGPETDLETQIQTRGGGGEESYLTHSRKIFGIIGGIGGVNSHFAVGKSESPFVVGQTYICGIHLFEAEIVEPIHSHAVPVR